MKNHEEEKKALIIELNKTFAKYTQELIKLPETQLKNKVSQITEKIQRELIYKEKFSDFSTDLSFKEEDTRKKDIEDFKALYDAVSLNMPDKVKGMDLKKINLALNKESVVSAIVYSKKYKCFDEITKMMQLLEKSGKKINIDEPDNAESKEALCYFYDQNYSYIDADYINNTFFKTICTGDINNLLDNA